MDCRQTIRLIQWRGQDFRNEGRAGADPGLGAGAGTHPWEGEAPFSNIEAPVHHWAPSPGINPVSASAEGTETVHFMPDRPTSGLRGPTGIRRSCHV